MHGWFTRLYYKKGGQEEFNCTPVKITKQDLLDLQADLENNNLETTTGFFFGETNEDKLNDAKEFVKSALLEIDGVTTMFYYAWY